MEYLNVKIPSGGAKITISADKLQVPDNPIIPFVESDGTGWAFVCAASSAMSWGFIWGLDNYTYFPARMAIIQA